MTERAKSPDMSSVKLTPALADKLKWPSGFFNGEDAHDRSELEPYLDLEGEAVSPSQMKNYATGEAYLKKTMLFSRETEEMLLAPDKDLKKLEWRVKKASFIWVYGRPGGMETTPGWTPKRRMEWKIVFTKEGWAGVYRKYPLPDGTGGRTVEIPPQKTAESAWKKLDEAVCKGR